MYIIIIAGGNISDYSQLRAECDKADKVICADSGIRHAKFINLIPDVWVGDFDSADGDYPAMEKVTLPCEKDDTDTHYAARLAVYLGASEVAIFGGIGSRLDHTLANISVLSFLDWQAVSARLIDEHNTVFLVKDSAEIKKVDGAYLSLIPLTEVAEGVTLGGVKYPLKNATLCQNLTLGISNEIIFDKVKLTVEKGMLAVFLSKD